MCPWLDEAEMRVGDSLIRKIQGAIDQTDFLCVILSPNSVSSEWVQREVDVALNGEISGKRVKVLPVLARTCDIPAFLATKVYADFRKKKDWEEGVRRLVMAVGADIRDSERYSGKRVSSVDDFVAKIHRHFAPRPVVLEFFEDWSGIEFIRVENGDGTFELYEFYTKPTQMDLINEIFGDRGGTPITDVEVRDMYLVTANERHAKLREICVRYGFPDDSYPAKWEELSEDKTKIAAAFEEWSNWLDGKRPVSLISGRRST